MSDPDFSALLTTPNAPRATVRGCARCGQPIAYKQPSVNGLHTPDCYRADREERLAQKGTTR